VARIRGRNRAYRERLVSMLDGAPKSPGELGWRAWFGVIKRTVVEFIDDDLNDRAASLTYYGILSIFPGCWCWSPASACSVRPQQTTSSTTSDRWPRARPTTSWRPASSTCTRTSGRRVCSRSSAS
jgi:hypothetical protein